MGETIVFEDVVLLLLMYFSFVLLLPLAKFIFGTLFTGGEMQVRFIRCSNSVFETPSSLEKCVCLQSKPVQLLLILVRFIPA